MVADIQIDPWRQLEGKIAPEVLQAPKTGGDPRGNWTKVHSRIVAYLERSVVEKPWADHLALLAAVLTAQQRDVNTVLNSLSIIHNRWTDLFQALGLQTIYDWDAQKHIPLYLKGEVLLEDNQCKRTTFWIRYSSATKQVWRWFKTLPEADKRVYQRFVLPKVDVEYVEGLVKRGEVEQKQQEIRKAETDALVVRFAEIRAEAHFRYNKIVRLSRAWYDVVEKLKLGEHRLPFSFSYQEGQEHLYFRVWDRRSFVLANRDTYSRTPITQAQKGLLAFSDERNTLFLEFVKAERSVGDAPPEGFWFEEIIKLGVLGQGPRCISDEEIAARQQEWLQSWGYREEDSNHRVTPFWTHVPGLLCWQIGESAFMTKAQARAEGVIVPVEALYAAATFGLLGIDLFTTTGMRINEAMQIRLSEECFVCMEIPPKGESKSPTFRYLFRLIPKGERTDTPHDYFIGEETKRLLVKVAQMLEEHYSISIVDGETLPSVTFHPGNGRSHRFGKAPYLFQYNHNHLPDNAITACMRFLVHGMVFKTREEKSVILKAHLLRHAFATHAVQVEKIPVDIVGAWLKQKNLDVTEYYSRVTETMVAETSDFLLARLATHINVGESILRSPQELQQQYSEAIKQVGTLAQVNGGSCTHHGICPSQFSCNGCPAKVPDPSKRYQVEHQRWYAQSMSEFYIKEGMLPAAERMKQLIRDCDIELQEMNWIEQYREDEKHDIEIHIEESTAGCTRLA